MDKILLNKKADFYQSAFFIIYLYGVKVLAVGFYVCLLVFSNTVFSKKEVFTINAEMKKPLVSIMDSVVLLHKTFYDKNYPQVKIIRLQMLHQIHELIQVSKKVLPPQQKAYMEKLLKSLIFHLEAFQASNHRHKESYLQAMNQKLTYISHIYGMKKYSVFFCPQDRSVWMQGNIPKPLHLSHTRCGTLVSRK